MESPRRSRGYSGCNQNEIARMISLENVLRNNPPTAETRDAFFKAYEKASERILELPWGYIQADLNAFNILPHGIIDFELAGVGPIGYDVTTNLYFGRMWPKKRIAYVFTEEQISRYEEKIDTIMKERKFPILSQYRYDFLALKAIWSTHKDKESEESPESNLDFWRWRVKLRDQCIRQYVHEERIDIGCMEEVNDEDC